MAVHVLKLLVLLVDLASNGSNSTSIMACVVSEGFSSLFSFSDFYRQWQRRVPSDL